MQMLYNECMCLVAIPRREVRELDTCEMADGGMQKIGLSLLIYVSIYLSLAIALALTTDFLCTVASTIIVYLHRISAIFRLTLRLPYIFEFCTRKSNIIDLLKLTLI